MFDSVEACESDVVVMTLYPQVATLVRFNRCLYAQMSQQHCEAPTRYPPLPSRSSPNYPAASLGLLLALGFELVAAASGQAPPARTEAQQAKQAQASSAPAAAAPGAGEQAGSKPQTRQGGPSVADQHATAQAQQQQQLEPQERQQTRAAMLASSQWGNFLASLEKRGYLGENIPGKWPSQKPLRLAQLQVKTY